MEAEKLTQAVYQTKEEIYRLIYEDNELYGEWNVYSNCTWRKEYHLKRPTENIHFLTKWNRSFFQT